MAPRPLGQDRTGCARRLHLLHRALCRERPGSETRASSKVSPGVREPETQASLWVRPLSNEPILTAPSIPVEMVNVACLQVLSHRCESSTWVVPPLQGPHLLQHISQTPGQALPLGLAPWSSESPGAGPTGCGGTPPAPGGRSAPPPCWRRGHLRSAAGLSRPQVACRAATSAA